MSNPTTAADDLRTAAALLRQAPHGHAEQHNDVVTVGDQHIGGCPACRVAPEMDHPDLIVALLNAREPLAALLDDAAEAVEELGVHPVLGPGSRTRTALAIARALTSARPGGSP